MVVGDFPLDGQIAVVTGGGSGINLAFVRLALSAGARILIADLKLLPEAAELVDSSDGKVEFTHCDVSDWSHLRSLPSEVQKAFGDDAIATVWIAGAGVFEPPWSDFLHDAETEHYKQLQINTEHPIKLTRIAMRSLLGAGRKGVVLIVASMAGITGSYGAPLYCASKHAVVGFTKSMAQADEDEGVKIVCCLPGMVSTPLWTGDAAKAKAQQYGYTEDVCISPEEVARAMVEMVQEGKFAGGTLLEVAKGRLREKLESRVAHKVDSEAMQRWEDGCYAPIREVYRSERSCKADTNGKANGVH